MLVIDDNAVNLDLMLYLLRSLGYDADGRSDGLAGLEAARSGAYALVFSDVLMPGIDGYELAGAMKSDPRCKDVPLIAVSALAMPEDRERILRSGFDGYIAKPIEPRAFADHVRALLKTGP